MTLSLDAPGAGAPPFDTADAPVEVTVAKGGRVVGMAFADGSSATVAAETLRLACRCAWCARARLDGRFPQAFPNAAIAEANPIGGYAVHLVFDDGHDRGVFPWTYARRLADAAPPARAA